MKDTITIPVSLIERVSGEYAKRFGINRTEEYFLLKLQEEFGKFVQAYMMLNGMGRKKEKSQKELEQQVSDELADVLCHAVLLAWHLGIDVEQVISEKWLKHLEDA